MIASNSFIKSNSSECHQQIYQLIFLNTENKTVEAWETNHLKLDNIIKCLSAGGSVFISSKRPLLKNNLINTNTTKSI